MFASFNRFELQMTMAEAKGASHQGQCDEDVAALLATSKIRRQFAKIDPNAIRAELADYGAWDDEQLGDDAKNQLRILWIAAGNIVEEQKA